MRWPTAIVVLFVLLAAGAGAYFLSEGRRYGERNRHLANHIEQLESELARLLHERSSQTEFLEEQVAEIRAARERRLHAVGEAFRTIPEGVRLILAAINQSLAEDGFPEVRFLNARALEDRALLDVEVVEHDRQGLATTVYVAERAELQLDREVGRLTIVLRDGHRSSPDGPMAYPAEGEFLAFADVHGPRWEGRLAHVLEILGDYPPPEPEAVVDGLDRESRAIWLDRLGRLLSVGEMDAEYRVSEVVGLEDAAFREVVLLGYREGRLLDLAIEAARMTVVVDRSAGTVELVLEEGTVRKSGGDVPIGPLGYRILLPSVTEPQAIDIMMGMVVHQ